MSNAPALLRYWLTEGRDFNGRLPDISIRIAWVDNGGVARSAVGAYDGGEIDWTLGSEVPGALAYAARDCAYDAGEHCDLPGCVFEGQETAEQMEEAVDALQDSRCFIARMATVEPVAPVAGTPEWLATLRLCGAL